MKFLCFLLLMKCITKSSLGPNVNTWMRCVFQQAHFSTLLWKCLGVEAIQRQAYCHVNTVLKPIIEIFAVTYISWCPYLLTDIDNVSCFIYNMQKPTHKLQPINAVGNSNLFSPPPVPCRDMTACVQNKDTDMESKTEFPENFSINKTMPGWLLRITSRVKDG